MEEVISWDGWICVALIACFLAFVLFRTLLDVVRDLVSARIKRIEHSQARVEHKVDHLLPKPQPKRAVPQRARVLPRAGYDADIVYVDFKTKKRDPKKNGSDDPGPNAA